MSVHPTSLNIYYWINVTERPLYSGSEMLLFIGWTLVTQAIKDEGTTKSCSIATLMKSISAFYKFLFHRDHLVRKSMQSITCQGYISTRKHS
jgi:hypothetical protein